MICSFSFGFTLGMFRLTSELCPPKPQIKLCVLKQLNYERKVEGYHLYRCLYNIYIYILLYIYIYICVTQYGYIWPMPDYLLMPEQFVLDASPALIACYSLILDACFCVCLMPCKCMLSSPPLASACPLCPVSCFHQLFMIQDQTRHSRVLRSGRVPCLTLEGHCSCLLEHVA